MSKLVGRYNRDLSPCEIDKCKKATIAFDGDICVEKVSDVCLKLKGEERQDNKNRIIDFSLQLHAHNGSEIDTGIVLSNLPCDKRIVSIIKNGNGIIELKIFNGDFEKKTNSLISTFQMWYDSFKLFFE